MEPPARPSVGSPPAGQRVLSGEAWDELVTKIASMKDLVCGPEVPDTPLHRAEGLRYLLRFLAAGIDVCVEHDDTEHPELGTFIENRRSWGLDNPDTNYSYCRLEPSAVYVVRGDPGTACRLELQVDTGHMADGNFAGWTALSRLAGHELAGRAGGQVEIVISPQRPEGCLNWMATGPDASFLHVREYFADWGGERPAVLTVERIGARTPPLPLGADTMERRLDLLGEWITTGARCWWELGKGLAGGEPGPITPFTPPPTATGLGGQAYGMGAYACEPDRAVVLELSPPRCAYWSVSLATWFWESGDIANRQCSLNHSQAAVDPDGVVRLVIAQRDPGVANWLDAAGYTTGTLAVRYLDAESLPTCGYRTVAFDELVTELPDSPRVDATERAASLRRRSDALVRRYR